MADEMNDYETVAECDSYYSGLLEGLERWCVLCPPEKHMLLMEVEMEHCRAVDDLENRLTVK